VYSQRQKILDSAGSQNAAKQHQSNNTSRNRPGKGSGNPSQQGNRPSNGKNNGGNASSTTTPNYTTYTGPEMVVKASMFFMFDDWKNKLTKAQKS
jgi:hypothetical protein